MQYEVYAAFSIHGSNTFITANKKVELPKRPTIHSKLQIDGIDFKVGKSRTSSLRDGIKLVSDELNVQGEPAKPTEDPQQVIAFFTRLENLGWSITDETFRHRHSLPVIDRKSKSKKASPAVEEAAQQAPVTTPELPPATTDSTNAMQDESAKDQ